MQLNKLDNTETIFPVDVKKTKLDKDTLKLIFEQFSFKFILSNEFPA